MPDLTSRQCQEELKMKDEVDRRNEEELTEDDLLKTCAVKWLGKERQSGEKRLVKGFNREVIVVAGRGERAMRPERVRGTGR
jgi:hypothetical protein